MWGCTGIPCSAAALHTTPGKAVGWVPRKAPANARWMWPGALTFQWIPQRVGTDTGRRQKALEPICTAEEVSTSFVLLVKREGGQREGGRGEWEEREGKRERGEERREHIHASPPHPLALACLLCFLANLLPYKQGLVFSFLLIPFAVFQDSLTDFKISLVTILFNTWKSKGEAWSAELPG